MTRSNPCDRSRKVGSSYFAMFRDTSCVPAGAASERSCQVFPPSWIRYNSSSDPPDSHPVWESTNSIEPAMGGPCKYFQVCPPSEVDNKKPMLTAVFPFILNISHPCAGSA